jgi:hypothetical protein
MWVMVIFNACWFRGFAEISAKTKIHFTISSWLNLLQPLIVGVWHCCVLGMSLDRYLLGQIPFYSSAKHRSDSNPSLHCLDLFSIWVQCVADQNFWFIRKVLH